MSTFLARHGCASAPQDQLHGPGVRLFNTMKAGGGRCTACGLSVAGVGPAVATAAPKGKKSPKG